MLYRHRIWKQRFLRRGENQSARRKNAQHMKENQQQKPCITSSLGVKHWPHWWEASAVGTKSKTEHFQPVN